MPRCYIAAAALVVLVAASAGAQQPVPGLRIAGIVKSVTASDVILTTDKGEIDVAVTPRTRVLRRQHETAGGIKPGAYLGTSNQDGATAGTGTATEVHLMENGGNVNYPMNDSGLTMTNGHVKSVKQTASGQEMEIDYGQAATRHVTVTKSTQVSRLIDIGVAGLTPGVTVDVRGMAGPEGKVTASFIAITVEAKPAP